jgi:RNA 2',3'-cyclic 3'-phosphodiesterase
LVDEPLLRLFFALPCPTDCAARIEHWWSSLGIAGKAVATSNLHLTLVFLGTQPAHQLPRLMALANSLHLPGFELTLDHLDLWPEGLLHLAPSQTPDALMQLALQLRQTLREAGFVIEQRAYRPHLTLAHHSTQPEMVTVPQVSWTAREFSLFSSLHSTQDAHYQALGSWPLR